MNDIQIIKSPTQLERERIAKALKEGAQKPQYLDNNDPRDGFLYNPFVHKMGIWFQKTIKNTVIENAIKIAWNGMIKYRCGGDKKQIREATKNADLVYKFSDPFIDTMDYLMKESVREFHTDNDKERKQNILFKCIDMFSFVVNEDIYYRARFKDQAKYIIQYFIDHPEDMTIFDKTEAEYKNVGKWNNYIEGETYGNQRKL